MRRACSLLLLGSAVAALAGCGSKATCTTEITDGTATYKGLAEGNKGDAKLPRESARDACRQRCAATKAVLLDACAARCTADIDGAKIGARTSCTDRSTP